LCELIMIELRKPPFRPSLKTVVLRAFLISMSRSHVECPQLGRKRAGKSIANLLAREPELAEIQRMIRHTLLIDLTDALIVAAQKMPLNVYDNCKELLASPDIVSEIIKVARRTPFEDLRRALERGRLNLPTEVTAEIQLVLASQDQQQKPRSDASGPVLMS